MTRAELITEFKRRGYDHIEDARCLLWVEQAYQEVCEERNWPFLEDTDTGTMPMTISDLRQILSVVDTTNDYVLSWEDRANVLRRDPDLNDTGSGYVYWLDNNVVTVHPGDTTSTYSVRFLKVPAALSSDSSEPLIPTRFQDLIIDGAVYRALKDNDEYDNAASLRQIWEAGVQKMADSLLVRQYDTPDFIRVTQEV